MRIDDVESVLSVKDSRVFFFCLAAQDLQHVIITLIAQFNLSGFVRVVHRFRSAINGKKKIVLCVETTLENDNVIHSMMIR